MAGLWTGISCPQPALQAVLRLCATQPDRRTPWAVHEVSGGRSRVVGCNRAARQAGVVPGQLLADALALAPSLELLPRSRRAEQDLLEELALLAYDYSHQVAITGDGVVLETGGSRRLHGELPDLLGHLDDRLEKAGLVARLGTAPVPAAACLLARAGRHAPDRTALQGMLDEWPLDRLGLSAVERERLRGLGLERVRDVLALPRAERERRIGRALNRHLDELRGRRQTPLTYWQPPETFRRQLALPVPSARTEALLFAVNRVLQHLGQWLHVRDRALTGLDVELRPENRGAPTRLHVGLDRPGFRRERLLELVRLKLEPVRLDAPIEELRIEAQSTVEHRPPQPDLWNGANTGDAWPALLDRLRARVGSEHLCGVAPCADHRPERAWRWTAPGTTATAEALPPRPNWLLPEPRPCRVEQLRLIEGPERIESGWWDGHDCRRDYWVAHDREGNRLWVFREYKPRTGWFIHGLFG